MHLLAARLARGEEAAFAELYDACADRLLAYLTARLGSRDRAADVLQETFLRAASARKRFRKVNDPAAYLFQIARNEAIRSNTREKRKRADPLVPADLFAADETGLAREQAELAATALNRIESADREIIELKIFAGLTFKEIAELTGMPQATVATKYRRVLEQLRPWLAKQLS